MTDDMVRALPDWIEGFMQFTDKLLSSEHYRRWAAYATISGVLERRVWSWPAGFLCYPNLYLLFMAKPGLGKSVAINEVEDLWVRCRNIHIGPNGMTKAALIDEINENHHDLYMNGKSYRYYPLCLAADEFGILLPEHNLELLNLFNTLYDCKEHGMSDRTRKDGRKVIEKPVLTLIAGTQPDYLSEILPPTAFGMGFTSRMIMIHSSVKKRGKFVVKRNEIKPEELRERLVHDLRIIQKLVGEFRTSPDAEEYMEDWYQNQDLDAPDHPLLEGYCQRRTAHIQKLAMVNSISRGNDLILEKEDYEAVHRMLLDAEDAMPQIFREMTTSGDKKHLEEAHHFIFRHCAKHDTITEERLMRYISGRVDFHRTKYFLETLINTGRIKLKGANNVGYRKFIPGEPD